MDIYQNGNTGFTPQKLYPLLTLWYFQGSVRWYPLLRLFSLHYITRDSSTHNSFAILLCNCLFEKSILTLIIHLSFLFPQCLYLIFFYYPILFLTSQNTSKTHTPLEMASSSEKQELRYSPTLVSHISDQKEKKLN